MLWKIWNFETELRELFKVKSNILKIKLEIIAKNLNSVLEQALELEVGPKVFFGT